MFNFHVCFIDEQGILWSRRYNFDETWQPFENVSELANGDQFVFRHVSALSFLGFPEGPGPFDNLLVYTTGSNPGRMRRAYRARSGAWEAFTDVSVLHGVENLKFAVTDAALFLSPDRTSATEHYVAMDVQARLFYARQDVTPNGTRRQSFRRLNTSGA